MQKYNNLWVSTNYLGNLWVFTKIMKFIIGDQLAGSKTGISTIVYGSIRTVGLVVQIWDCESEFWTGLIGSNLNTV